MIKNSLDKLSLRGLLSTLGEGKGLFHPSQLGAKGKGGSLLAGSDSDFKCSERTQ